MFCRSSFVLLSFFFWPLCCLSFLDLQILIISLGIFKLFLQLYKYLFCWFCIRVVTSDFVHSVFVIYDICVIRNVIDIWTIKFLKPMSFLTFLKSSFVLLSWSTVFSKFSSFLTTLGIRHLASFSTILICLSNFPKSLVTFFLTHSFNYISLLHIP